MNMVTAITILLILFLVRFVLPFGLMMLINWYNDQVAVNPA